MKIAFIADGRSNNFRRWVRYFSDCGDDVSVLSTYPCESLENIDLFILPTPVKAGNALVKSSKQAEENLTREQYSIFDILKGALLKVAFPLWNFWNLLKLVNLPFQAFQLRKLLNRIEPNITVAFRTQNEGYIAALSRVHPVALFTQGSDFIYMANRHRLHAYLTKMTVQRVDALLSDCDRDVKFAKHYGLSTGLPTQVLPGNGGVDLSVFTPGVAAQRRVRLVVYPRGLTPYLKFDTFLTTVQKLQQLPQYQDVDYILLGATSVVPLMQKMAERRGLDMGRVSVKTFLPKQALVSLLQQAAVIVSPSLTDGTPNTMLEAMACGAFPIMSDLDSIREWIQHRENGLLFDPNSPEQLTSCLKRSLDDMSLCQSAQLKNIEMIRERADRNLVMPRTRDFLLNKVKNQNTTTTENVETISLV